MKHFLTLGWIILSSLCLSCARPFDEFSKSKSGNIPKQYLIIKTLGNSQILGYGARLTERSVPVIEGEVLYTGSVRGYFLALKKTSGSVVWRKKIKGGVESSPYYLNEKIYFGANDGNFYCVEAKTGKTLWTYATHSEIYSQPLIKGGIVYFITAKNELLALKAETGQWVWYHNKGYVQKFSLRGTSSPLYDDGKIYAGFSDGSLVAFNAFTGEIVWERLLSKEEKFIDVDATPVMVGDTLYAGTGDGHLYALEARTGNTRWQKKFQGIQNLETDQKKLYVADLSHKVSALNLEDGKKIWDFEVKKGVPSDMLMVEGQMVFGTSEGYIYSLSIDEGKELWRYKTDSGFFTKPVFNADRLYLYTQMSSIHVIDPFYLLAE